MGQVINDDDQRIDYDDQNVFARIIRKEIPAKAIFENEVALAFHDISAAAKVHVLVVPKGRYRDFSDFAGRATPKEQTGFMNAINEVVKTLGVGRSGYRLIANSGANAHQTVPHFHMHILGGQELGPLIAGDSELR